MFLWLTSNLLWTEGKVILAIIAAFYGVGFALHNRVLMFLSLLFFAFSFYFFRSPERTCKEFLQDNTVLICPADGAVVDVAYDASKSFKGYAQKVSIFLSPLDVHVNWIPMDGIVEKIIYVPGSFIPAFLPKSSELNEHNDIVIKNEQGSCIMVRQIAGTIARRICCWVQEHRSIKAGEKYGMIRFGSRVDIFLPENVELTVSIGQRVYGGQTVIGRWKRA